MKNIFFLFLLVGSVSVDAFAQTPFERLGQKAMMNGQFLSAASYFEKAYAADNTNMSALWLMGYSYYHASDYRKSIETFDKLLSFKPSETIAYYYRGKAKCLLSGSLKDALEKEKTMVSAIKDFTTGIQLNPGDMKFYQNRGIAYQDYGLFKSQKMPNIYNKGVAVNAVNSSINDFKKILEDGGFRKDIQSQIEKSKQLLVNIK